MKASYAQSADGTRIAYDCCGNGPAVLLLHGGGTNRQEWHDVGYVGRLWEQFIVMTMDLRGHGESGAPTDPSAYNTDEMGQDMLAVADACGIERFAMWAMSFGGKIGRYLAIRSERVERLVLMGTPLGPGVSDERRQQAVGFLAHWSPIVKAHEQGTLDLNALSTADREAWSRLNVPAMMGWVRAMLDWPSVEPADFRCPVLWLVGSEDPHAMESLDIYRPSLEGSRVQVKVLDGLDHEQIFAEVDRVLPTMLDFTRYK